MKHSRRSIRYVNLIFGVAFGWLICRLILGPYYEYPALYAHTTWIFLYPVHLLRQNSDLTIFVLFYTLFWLYVFVVKITVLNAPFFKTLSGMIIWMFVVALPFLPFGVEYFSLAVYTTSISGYLLRLLPFVALLASLFLANRFYFNQSYLFAGTWALVNFLLVIVIVTLSNLLPALKSLIFFNALDYRLALVNDVFSVFPLLSLLIIMCLSVFYIFIFESQFLRLPDKRTTLKSIATPIGVLVALSLVLMIMRDDFTRYRVFDYRGGISTVYFARYDDRQTLSFDDCGFTLSSEHYSVFYPFGRFSIRDTLRRHAEQILRMKIIEGLDYYRLERIAEIVAHGPRDEKIYKQLEGIIDGKRYRLPERFVPWAQYISHRYKTPSQDIEVTGWVMVNDGPLSNTEFMVNRIASDNRRRVEPVWKDRTDSLGQFRFSCYRNYDLDDIYFQMVFLLPVKLVGREIDYLEVAHSLPAFRNPGSYVLDTLRIRSRSSDRGVMFKELTVCTSVPADSLLLFLPYLPVHAPAHFFASVSVSGSVDSVVPYYQLLPDDSVALEEIIERVKSSKFYLKKLPGSVEVRLN